MTAEKSTYAQDIDGRNGKGGWEFTLGEEDEELVLDQLYEGFLQEHFEGTEEVTLSAEIAKDDYDNFQVEVNREDYLGKLIEKFRGDKDIRQDWTEEEYRLFSNKVDEFEFAGNGEEIQAPGIYIVKEKDWDGVRFFSVGIVDPEDQKFTGLMYDYTGGGNYEEAFVVKDKFVPNAIFPPGKEDDIEPLDFDSEKEIFEKYSKGIKYDDLLEKAEEYMSPTGEGSYTVNEKFKEESSGRVLIDEMTSRVSYGLGNTSFPVDGYELENRIVLPTFDAEMFEIDTFPFRELITEEEGDNKVPSIMKEQSNEMESDKKNIKL